MAVTLLCGAIMLHATFPKSGFKFQGIPFTLPDITFGLLLIVVFFRLLRPFHASKALKECSLLLVLGMLYFAFRILFERYYGYPQAAADDLMYLTALCVYPLIFFALLVIVDRPQIEGLILRIIRLSLVIVLVYGMAQKLFGDYHVVIPGLTANWDDAHEPEFLAGKSNMLWDTGALKLTSTFQNGNILGVNLLIFLALAVVLCRSGRAKLLLLGAGVVELALTASRSAWGGGVFLALLSLQLAVKRPLHKIVLGAFLVVGLYAFVFYVPIARSRIVAASEGGISAMMSERMEPASILVEDSVIRNRENDVQAFLIGPYRSTKKRIVLAGGGAYEMFYLALFEIGGTIGVLLWLAPVVFSLTTFYRHRTDAVVRAVFLGIAAWSCAAVMEGAYWLPPTAFNLWMLIGVGWLRLIALERSAPLVESQRRGMALNAPRLSGVKVRGCPGQPAALGSR